VPPQFGPFAGWILAKQAEFYRMLSGSIRAAKANGTATWGLMGISFAYLVGAVRTSADSALRK
jgi:nickel/cobalt exporter